MRLKRITAFDPVNLRKGVIARVMATKRSAHTPVSLVRSLSGLALRFPVVAAQTSHANGPRLAAKTSGFSPHRSARSETFTRQLSTALVVLLQIHAGVHARNLVAVAVEHQRPAFQELADAPLGRLAPPRVIDGGVDVRIEAVLLRRRFLPGVQRLPFRELDLDD